MIKRRIFISYSRKDQNLVKGLRDVVRTSSPDLSVFVDSYSICPGEDWESRLVSEIRGCDAVYVVWTYNARNSAWVCREIEIALQEKFHRPSLDIIPIYDGRAQLPSSLAVFQSISLTSSSAVSSRSAYLLAGALVGSVISSYLACVFFREIVDLLVILNAWSGVIFFSGLRKLHAPWNPEFSSDMVGVLFGVVHVKKDFAQAIFVFNLVSILVLSYEYL